MAIGSMGIAVPVPPDEANIDDDGDNADVAPPAELALPPAIFTLLRGEITLLAVLVAVAVLPPTLAETLLVGTTRELAVVPPNHDARVFWRLPAS